MDNKDQLTLSFIADFLSKLAEKSNYVYWLSSVDLKEIKYISPAFEKIWHRTRDALYRNPEVWIQYMHPEDSKNRHPVHELARNITEQGVDARYEESYRIIRPNGEIRWILDRGFPICNDQGQCIGVTGVAIDITENKVHEQKLEKAMRDAQAANEAKSQFIANMSHDIRTPITGILGLAQSLKDHATSEADRQNAQLLVGATEQLLSLLNEIIEVVRIKEGKKADDKENFDLIALIEHNVELLQPALQDKKLFFNNQIQPGIPRYLYGHRIYLSRILLNLLSNAIKFTEKGHVSLIVSAKKTGGTKSKVILKIIVEDSGIGIPKDKFEAIFEHFSRLSPSYKGRYKGYGLGLFTVKRYLEAMKGHIKVESKLGKGSCFTVTIPFKTGEKTVTKVTRVFETGTDEKFQQQLKPQLRKSKIKPRILLVEDEPLAALMATRLFEESDCQVIHATEGAEALKKAAKQRFDLILMDLGLPDQSGFQVTRKIRKQCPPNAKTPIIALTGHMAADKRKECLSVGMQEMLTKPLTILTTQQLLTTYIFEEAIASTIAEKPESFKELPSIDLEDGSNILNGNLKAAKQALDLLAKSLPNDYRQIQKNYRLHDYETLYEIVHKLYGGLCYCGTPRLRKISQLLKQALVKKRGNELSALMQQLAEEVETFLKTYKELKSPLNK